MYKDIHLRMMWLGSSCLMVLYEFKILNFLLIQMEVDSHAYNIIYMFSFQRPKKIIIVYIFYCMVFKFYLVINTHTLTVHNKSLMRSQKLWVFNIMAKLFLCLFICLYSYRFLTPFRLVDFIYSYVFWQLRMKMFSFQSQR